MVQAALLRCGDMLRAFERGVLIVDETLAPDHRQDVAREVSVTRAFVTGALRELGVTDDPRLGSVHFHRIPEDAVLALRGVEGGEA